MEPTLVPLAFSVQDAAERIGLSRSKFYLELAAGRIQAKKIGRRTVILESELQRYLQTLTQAR